MCNNESILNVAQIIRDGGVIAFPTETVYCLGAVAFHKTAAEKLFARSYEGLFNE